MVRVYFATPAGLAVATITPELMLSFAKGRLKRAQVRHRLLLALQSAVIAVQHIAACAWSADSYKCAHKQRETSATAYIYLHISQ